MAEEINLREEDRLPWLETVEPDEPEGPPLGRVIAAVVLGLGVLALIIFGIFKLQQHGPAGNGELIAAQEGDYKVRPDDPGGLKVSGEGDSAVATSAGKGSGTGAIDLKQVPEAPITGKRATTHPGSPAGASNAVSQVPASGGKLVAAAPIQAPARSAASASSGGGSLVQLGAFPSEAAANTAWTGFSKRFGYIAPLGKSVQPVSIGGKTFYRLRVNAGSAGQAADLCGRLKVAGESCFVAS